MQRGKRRWKRKRVIARRKRIFGVGLPTRRELLQAMDWDGFTHSPIPALCLGLGLTFLLAQLLWGPRTAPRTFSIDQLKLPLHATEIPETPRYWPLFHPVWRDGNDWFLLPGPASANGLEESRRDMRTFVRDPEKRVEALFHVEPYLEDRVVFWMLVHAKYSRKFRLVHDRDNPGVIYGYMDFRPLYRKYGVTAALDVHIRRAEKAIVEELKRRLAATVGILPVETLEADERIKISAFLSGIGGLSKARVAELNVNVRTQTGQRDEFEKALQRSRQLLPHIESVMKRAGLPAALARLPFVESSFNEKAHSKVGAVGIWQFMPATARQYIHRSDRALWADPIVQTRAASRLLRNYRSALPDWGTTLTSYNSGIGRIGGMLRRHRLTGIKGLLTLPVEKQLGFAGQNFYAQFLSANLVEAYKEVFFPTLVPPGELVRVFDGSALPVEYCEL